jgi:hypothetical protein
MRWRSGDTAGLCGFDFSTRGVRVTGVTDAGHPLVQVRGIDDLPALETAMLRFVLSAMALAGILATTLPAFADPPPATAADHARVAAVATTLSAPATPARLSPPAAPEPDGHDTEISPVGPGWG